MEIPENSCWSEADTCYSRKKYEKAEFRKSQWFEYRGYEYFIHPDAYYITGYEVWKQHQEEQDKIDKMIEEQEKDRKYQEEHPEEIRRSEENKFNKSIVYLGDKGLKGTTDDFKELYEVFGGLITEKEFIRDVIENNKIVKYNLKSDGVVVFFTEPYTNLRQHNAGDQYFTRSTYITVNPVDDGLSVFLQDETKENKFYDTHEKYIEYIIKHPIELKITNEIKTQIYYASNGDLRTAKAYCQYLQIGNPLIKDVNEFLEVFKPQKEITNIEHMIYTKLYKNLKVLTNDDLSYKLTADGRVGNIDDMLTSTKDRKSKSFFTAKQIATYFKNDFKMNKNLKDTIEDIPKILKNLYNAEYIELVLEGEYQNQEVYYIPKRDEMENQ